MVHDLKFESLGVSPPKRRRGERRRGRRKRRRRSFVGYGVPN